MKPEMVDATLVKKNSNGLRKKGKNSSNELLFETDNTPLDLSRATQLTSDDELLQDSTTQLFYVYNPPTQTYEPVTIISLGEEEEDDVQIVEASVLPSIAEQAETSLGSFVNNIATDHEEIVQTCEDTITHIGGEVIVCDTYHSPEEREEIVDEYKISEELRVKTNTSENWVAAKKVSLAR